MSGLWYATPDSWQLPSEADRRFNRLTTIALLVFVILGILIPYFEFTGEQEGGGDTAERYVSLLPDAQIAEKVEEPAPAPEDKPKPEQPKAETKKQDKPPEPKRQEEVVIKPQPTQAQIVEKARETAARSGLLADPNQFESQSPSLSGFDTARPLERITAQAGTGASGGSTQVFERQVASGSSGIGATGSGETRRQSGTGMDTRRTTKVDSPVGFGEDKTKPGQGGDKLFAGRTKEEIQLVFDRNNSMMASIHKRAAMANPNLEGGGTIIVKFTIAPNGSVTACELINSPFNDPDFERKIIQRVLTMNFGAKDVPPFTVARYELRFHDTLH